MSKEQYNLKIKTDYLNRKMFLDPSGPVTIQRFEEVKYNKLQKLEQTARGFFWVPEEISLTKDANDFKEASDAVKHIFTSNLKRQILLDSVQGRSPNLAFLPLVSLPELETWIETWAFNETIHSRSYTHIIRNVYSDPGKVFDDLTSVDEIANAYRTAWKTGLKGITVFRYGSKGTQVLELGTSETATEKEHFIKCDPTDCRL